MNLPIQWRVLPAGPSNRYQMLLATVVVNRERYTKQMAMPAAVSKATWWLCVSAITAEINNAVGTDKASGAIKSPPAI
jgi:hypothetical protein